METFSLPTVKASNRPEDRGVFQALFDAGSARSGKNVDKEMVQFSSKNSTEMGHLKADKVKKLFEIEINICVVDLFIKIAVNKFFWENPRRSHVNLFSVVFGG